MKTLHREKTNIKGTEIQTFSQNVRKTIPFIIQRDQRLTSSQGSFKTNVIFIASFLCFGQLFVDILEIK